jgi:hypothetical protein
MSLVISEPQQFRYVKLKGYKERNDMARYYRAIHRRNAKLAREIWKAHRAIARKFEQEFADDVLNGSNGSPLL